MTWLPFRSCLKPEEPEQERKRRGEGKDGEEMGRKGRRLGGRGGKGKERTKRRQESDANAFFYPPHPLWSDPWRTLIRVTTLFLSALTTMATCKTNTPRTGPLSALPNPTFFCVIQRFASAFSRVTCSAVPRQSMSFCTERVPCMLSDTATRPGATLRAIRVFWSSLQ